MEHLQYTHCLCRLKLHLSLEFVQKTGNDDGHMDLLLAGNYYKREVETTRSDAGIGCLLLGDGQGKFSAMPAAEAGLELYRDVRALALINGGDKKTLVVAANNNDIAELISLR